MTDSQQSASPASPEIWRIVRAVRFALVCIVLGLSYFDIHVSLAIPDFQRIFADMIEGTALPLITTLVIHGHWALVTCSFLLPATALGTFFFRATTKSIYIIGVLALMTILQTAIMCQGLSDPLFRLTKQLDATIMSPTNVEHHDH
jgi:hypothetical protein